MSNITEKEFIKKYQTMTQCSLSKELGWSIGKLQYWSKKLGLPPKKRGAPKKKVFK